jgi:hypothetical protein
MRSMFYQGTLEGGVYPEREGDASSDPLEIDSTRRPPLEGQFYQRKRSAGGFTRQGYRRRTQGSKDLARGEVNLDGLKTQRRGLLTREGEGTSTGVKYPGIGAREGGGTRRLRDPSDGGAIPEAKEAPGFSHQVI